MEQYHDIKGDIGNRFKTIDEQNYGIQTIQTTVLTDNYKIGNLVLMKDNNKMELKWKMDRIVKVYPGEDNHVRVVAVKTAKSEYIRPITKLCLLPIQK